MKAGVLVHPRPPRLHRQHFRPEPVSFAGGDGEGKDDDEDWAGTWAGRVWWIKPKANMNAAGLRITRFPYEEPYHLNLWVEASNGKVNGRLECYCNADDLNSLGDKLLGYIGGQDEKVVYELGSEKPEDRFAFFFSLITMPLDLAGHSVIRFRMNNNRPPPEKEASEFCIPVEVAGVNRLGRLLVAFGKLEHRVLDWSVKDGKLLKEVEAWSSEVSRSAAL